MMCAARAILAERGVDGLTVDEVADQSGVAKSTIYRHFGSVDELILAAVDELIPNNPAPDTGSFERDLRCVKPDERREASARGSRSSARYCTTRPARAVDGRLTVD